jgi:hypothetical protein
MKRTEAIKKVREAENAIEAQRLKKLRQMEAEMDLENRESNRNRARSITVGTAFGGTTEVMMRSDGGRHIWCTMQPIEVVELIHQLSANVGCNVALKPRDDFASWRDWRVSDAEKKHLNGHVPHVNDMAVFQQLGASGYNDEEAKRIMGILANVKGFANENDDAKILLQATKGDGAPNLMVGEEDGLLHNKVVMHDNEVVYMAGGNGGRPDLEGAKNVATETPVNGRKSKRPSASSK